MTVFQHDPDILMVMSYLSPLLPHGWTLIRDVQKNGKQYVRFGGPGPICSADYIISTSECDFWRYGCRGAKQRMVRRSNMAWQASLAHEALRSAKWHCGFERLLSERGFMAWMVQTGEFDPPGTKLVDAVVALLCGISKSRALTCPAIGELLGGVPSFAIEQVMLDLEENGLAVRRGCESSDHPYTYWRLQ